MIHSRSSRSVTSALLWLSLLPGCAVAPASTEGADVRDASAPAEIATAAPDASAPVEVTAAEGERRVPGAPDTLDPVGAPFRCNTAVCNVSCATQPGVAGGACEGNLCVCDAPTCGAFDQNPCAGNYCSQGHYDAWLNLCDNCGASGATCCDYQHAGATTSCYGTDQTGPLYCQNGFECESCGAVGQQPCQPANGSPFCNSPAVVALSGNTPVCAARCGVSAQPCYDGGCGPYASLDTYTGICTPTCGFANLPCCDAGSVFQEGWCNAPSDCEYFWIPPFGNWGCEG